jgi:hypothetical protein
MSKASSYLHTGASALEQVWLNGASGVVVRFAIVVLISILISHVHAEPV